MRWHLVVARFLKPLTCKLMCLIILRLSFIGQDPWEWSCSINTFFLSWLVVDSSLTPYVPLLNGDRSQFSYICNASYCMLGHWDGCYLPNLNRKSTFIINVILWKQWRLTFFYFTKPPYEKITLILHTYVIVLLHFFAQSSPRPHTWDCLPLIG